MRRFAIATLLAALTLVGCGGSGKDKWVEGRQQTVPASGVVTYKGEPLVDATVILVPAASGGVGCAAKSDEEGKFELSAYPETLGAVPGSYTVMITKIEVPPLPGGEDDGPAVSGPVYAKQLIPVKYGNPAQSGLKVDIPETGKTDITFALTD